MDEKLSSPRTCFIMMPFSDDYKHILDQAIRPAVETYELECVVADRSHIGSIPEQISREIQRAIVCIAEVSDGNPNVMYEVGAAQAMGKPVIFLAKKLNKVPFDVSHMQIIKYSNSKKGLCKLGKDLRQAFRDAAQLEEVSRMLIPANLKHSNGPFVIAASPLSWRVGRRKAGGFKTLTGTFSDSFGIRSLLMEFGFQRRMDRLPELLNPEDYVDEVVREPMHLYSIGSPKANSWTGLMLKEFNKKWRPAFTFAATGDNLRDVSLKVQKEGKDLKLLFPSFEEDFGLIIRGPNPFNEQYQLTILAGCRSTGTEAACRAATSATLLAMISRMCSFNFDSYENAFYAVVKLKRFGKLYNYAADLSSMSIVEAELFEPRPLRKGTL